MKKDLIKFLQDKHNATGGHNGTSLAVLKNVLNIDIIDLKKILNQLHKDEKIVVKKGINSKLVFWNGKKA